ncbi:MAG: hypothetical protein U9Q12_04165, partial [Patescibacteria group bacterium]|nr:hypothetical protein [Patescibacteria group bacterium]
MKEIESLEKLLSSVQQYQNKALLEPEAFMELFDNCLAELQITKIDHTVLSDPIKEVLNIVDWFKTINQDVVEILLEDGESVTDEINQSYIDNSFNFSAFVVTSAIRKKHQNYFGTYARELDERCGYDIANFREKLHLVSIGKKENIIVIELLASLVLETLQTYIGQIKADGLLPKVKLAKTLYEDTNLYENKLKELIYALEFCIDTYLKEYAISSILLPYRNSCSALSANIDEIYKTFDPNKTETSRSKLEEIFNSHKCSYALWLLATEEEGTDEEPRPQEKKPDSKIDDDLSESHEHQVSNNDKITKITSNLETDDNK